MSLAQCMDLVNGGDPDRALVLRAASDGAQARLFPIYALNLEIARAAWASSEPLVAEMRLQWWRDAIEDLCGAGFARAHPVLAACDFLARDAKAGHVLDDLIEARRWDIWRDPFTDNAALWAHLGATGGGLMALGGHVLGAPDTAGLRDLGSAMALAQWLRAVPDLQARGRHPLPDTGPDAIAELARQGLQRLQAARAARGGVARAALPAALTAWATEPVLRQAAQDPDTVLQGTLRLPAPGLRLTWAALTGRW